MQFYQDMMQINKWTGPLLEALCSGKLNTEVAATRWCTSRGRCTRASCDVTQQQEHWAANSLLSLHVTCVRTGLFGCWWSHGRLFAGYHFVSFSITSARGQDVWLVSVTWTCFIHVRHGHHRDLDRRFKHHFQPWVRRFWTLWLCLHSSSITSCFQPTEPSVIYIAAAQTHMSFVCRQFSVSVTLNVWL